jgi:hypothetical protein
VQQILVEGMLQVTLRTEIFKRKKRGVGVIGEGDDGLLISHQE